MEGKILSVRLMNDRLRRSERLRTRLSQFSDQKAERAWRVLAGDEEGRALLAEQLRKMRTVSTIDVATALRLQQQKHPFFETWERELAARHGPLYNKLTHNRIAARDQVVVAMQNDVPGLDPRQLPLDYLHFANGVPTDLIKRREAELRITDALKDFASAEARSAQKMLSLVSKSTRLVPAQAAQFASAADAHSRALPADAIHRLKLLQTRAAPLLDNRARTTAENTELVTLMNLIKQEREAIVQSLIS